MKKDLNKLSFSELKKEVEDLEKQKDKVGKKSIGLWKVGEKYFIRTVTMHYTGKLLDVTPTELLFGEASWIADSGRFHDALKNGSLDEVEPFPDKVLIPRTSIIDASVWLHDLPREQK
jgi:hypothetical protein